MLCLFAKSSHLCVKKRPMQTKAPKLYVEQGVLAMCRAKAQRSGSSRRAELRELWLVVLVLPVERIKVVDRNGKMTRLASCSCKGVVQWQQSSEGWKKRPFIRVERASELLFLAPGLGVWIHQPQEMGFDIVTLSCPSSEEGANQRPFVCRLGCYTSLRAGFGFNLASCRAGSFSFLI